MARKKKGRPRRTKRHSTGKQRPVRNTIESSGGQGVPTGPSADALLSAPPTNIGPAAIRIPWKYNSNSDDLLRRNYTDADRTAWIQCTTHLASVPSFPVSYRFRLWCHANWHNMVRPVFKAAPSSVASGLEFILAVTHALSPFVVAVYAGITKVDGWLHLLAFAAIYFSALCLVRWYHRRNHRAREHERDAVSRATGRVAWEGAYLHLQQCLTVVVGEQASKDSAKQYLSQWVVENLTRRIRAFDASLAINIFVFVDDQCERFRACTRASAIDGGLYVDIPHSLLNWAARTGANINVPSTHFSWHPFDVNPKLPVQSKILFPLLEYDENDKDAYCWGVLSVEAPHPFYFHSRRGRDVPEVMQPLMKLVKLVNGTPQFRRKVDKP